jgi:hypothetical protein
MIDFDRRVACKMRENLFLFIPASVMVLIYVSCEVDIDHRTISGDLSPTLRSTHSISVVLSRSWRLVEICSLLMSLLKDGC